MLKVRVITGCILGALLLLGLFLLPPFWAVLAFALVFLIGAWEWAGFGALRQPLARALYTLVRCPHPLRQLALDRRFPAPEHSPERGVRVVAHRVPMAQPRARVEPAGADACLRPGCLGAGFRGARPNADFLGRVCTRPGHRAVAGADGMLLPISAPILPGGPSGGENWRRG